MCRQVGNKIIARCCQNHLQATNSSQCCQPQAINVANAAQGKQRERELTSLLRLWLAVNSPRRALSHARALSSPPSLPHSVLATLWMLRADAEQQMLLATTITTNAGRRSSSHTHTHRLSCAYERRFVADAFASCTVDCELAARLDVTEERRRRRQRQRRSREKQLRSLRETRAI